MPLQNTCQQCVPKLDTNWLWSVLRHAKKNPDMFPEVKEGCYVLDENDVLEIADALDKE